jgi:hypothetical protein
VINDIFIQIWGHVPDDNAAVLKPNPGFRISRPRPLWFSAIITHDDIIKQNKSLKKELFSYGEQSYF